MANLTIAGAMQGEVSMCKGPWHEDEDERLITFVKLLGSRRWDYVARVSGLKRSGKSCRLRWVNYLRPNLKRGRITSEEEMIILKLHEKWGNKWSMIARRLPGRTDNEIKNYWRTHLSKKAVIQDQEDDGSSDSKTCINGDSYNYCVDSSCHDGAGAAKVSDFDLTVTRTSPYETRLSDWISEFQSEQDSNTSPAWFYEENDLWGCSLGSLWNME